MFVYGVETSVYVHLTEERGYYLVFRLGELRQRDKYRSRAIFIAVAAWIAQFIA